MIFYDFEVLAFDWLVIFMDTDIKKTTIIKNNPDKLKRFYERHKKDVFVGYNNKHYDNYIFQGILAGHNPKEINDFIIKEHGQGWQFADDLKQYPIICYDTFTRLDRGLKWFEGSLGNDIQESKISFDIDRKLTDEELDELTEYCKHDVEQTMAVFLHKKNDFYAQCQLIKMFKLPMSDLAKTKAQTAAKILQATKTEYDDEFSIDLPPNLTIQKYKDVISWYSNPFNFDYDMKLETEVAGVPHTFGWGGVHGAREKYNSTGYFINMDVTSLYPSLMIEYDLHSRSCNATKYKEIYDQRIKYKRAKNALQQPLKIVLNSTYGAMKDKYNALYDPRQANRVCVYGQLLLLDLIENLERKTNAILIQSNTDGVLIKMPYGQNEDDFYDAVDDVAAEWEKRTRLKLEFEEYEQICQKDVNNYLLVDLDGKTKSKGAYTKELSPLDYDLPIVNLAMRNYMVYGCPPSITINSCNNLLDFQMICRCSHKYKCLYHGDKKLNERTVRVFASTDEKDPGLTKENYSTGTKEKVAGTPQYLFIDNSDVHEKQIPDKLDKEWYINLTRKRLEDYGLI